MPLLVALAPTLCASSTLAGPITVIDGDTVERDGQRWRLSDIDAPELHHARCAAERTLAIKSAARLVELLEASGGRVIDSGRREKYGRHLGRLIIGWPTTGEETWSAIAIREGLAVAWNGRGRAHDWCHSPS